MRYLRLEIVSKSNHEIHLHFVYTHNLKVISYRTFSASALLSPGHQVKSSCVECSAWHHVNTHKVSDSGTMWISDFLDKDDQHAVSQSVTIGKSSSKRRTVTA